MCMKKTLLKVVEEVSYNFAKKSAKQPCGYFFYQPVKTEKIKQLKNKEIQR